MTALAFGARAQMNTDGAVSGYSGNNCADYESGGHFGVLSATWRMRRFEDDNVRQTKDLAIAAALTCWIHVLCTQ